MMVQERPAKNRPRPRPSSRRALLGRVSRATWALLLATLLASSSPAQEVSEPPRAEPAPQNPSLEIYDKFAHEVSRHFYDKQFGGVDWATLVAEQRQVAEHTPPGRPLRVLMRSLLARLGNSHATVVHADVHRVVFHFSAQ